VFLLGTVLLNDAYTLLPFFLENLVVRDLQSQLWLTEKPEVNWIADHQARSPKDSKGGR